MIDTAVGPRGGDLNRPEYCRERRESHAQSHLLDSGELALHRFEPDAVAKQGLKNEQSWHRVAAWMLATTDASLADVAKAAGVNYETVGVLNSQLWFQELKATFASEVGRSIGERFRQESEKCLDTMIALRDNDERDDNNRPLVSPATKAKICTDIIEQAHGKAVQKIISVSATTTFSSEQEEVEALKAKLQAIRDARRTGAPNSEGEARVAESATTTTPVQSGVTPV